MIENRQSMIFKMKHILITFFLLVSMSTIGYGQNTMRLDEYTICSSQLDSIVNMVLSDVENEDYIVVTANKNGNNIYTISVSAFFSYNLHYRSSLLGYTKKGDKTIFFYSSAKDMISKKTDSHKKTFSCIPPPTKDNPLPIISTDGVKEWFFRIEKGNILLLRKFLEW